MAKAVAQQTVLLWHVLTIVKQKPAIPKQSCFTCGRSKIKNMTLKVANDKLLEKQIGNDEGPA